MGRPQGHTGQAPVLNSSEFMSVMDAARKRKFADRDRTVLMMSFYLGLRAKEIASLKIGDVYAADDTVRPVLHIKRTYSKKNRMRDVYVSAESLRNCLASYRESRIRTDPEAPLFPTRTGKHFSPNRMAHLFREIYACAGIEASSHSGRRSMITRLVEQGVDLKAIATLAGHASVTTTCIYVDTNPARLARIMGQIDTMPMQ